MTSSSDKVKLSNQLANSHINLHKLWDDGVGSLGSINTIDHVTAMTKIITSIYPPSYFGDKVNDLDPHNWAKEGMENAKKYVYATPENEIVSTAYVENGRKIAQQELALAGYRLGKILNQLLING